MKHFVIVLLVLLCGCSQKPAERTHIRMAVGGVAQFVYLPAALAKKTQRSLRGVRAVQMGRQ